MSTLVLTRADVARHIEALPLLEELRRGFRAYSAGPRIAGGTTFAGAPPEVPAYTVKPDEPTGSIIGGVPLSSVMELHDKETGEILAVMESEHLGALRTGLVGAVAADVLARPDAAKVAVIGSDRAASIALKCLRLVRSLRRVLVWDENIVHSEQFAQRIYETISLPARATDTVEEAVGEADIVITARSSPRPFLYPGMLRAGTHVNAFGADMPGRAELSANLIRQSLFFCDDRDLATSVGALANVGLGPEAVAAELGEVLEGAHPGRTSNDDVTLFAGFPLPFQDLAMAWATYEGARSDETIARVELGA